MTSVQEVKQDRRGSRVITYQLETVRCGKRGCRCASGERHGPYWFAYWKHIGRRRKRYLGAEFVRLSFEQLRSTERSSYFKAYKKARQLKKKKKNHEEAKDHGGGAEGSGGAFGGSNGGAKESGA